MYDVQQITLAIIILSPALKNLSPALKNRLVQLLVTIPGSNPFHCSCPTYYFTMAYIAHIFPSVSSNS